MPRTDHPRSRGEYRPKKPGTTVATGSSPLSRGILLGLAAAGVYDRIIPALAGNTASVPRGHCTRGDHPRSRGEYLDCSLLAPVGQGSSPLSRGILERHSSTRKTTRIIPALAGNTARNRMSCSSSRDHPRSRGEYHRGPRREGSPGGSSPLSRGILMAAAQEVVKPRIIPALAGNTMPRYSFRHSLPDHPRSRGEYRAARMTANIMSGSSPLSRGIPSDWATCEQPGRIIPALAGNTPSQPGN